MKILSNGNMKQSWKKYYLGTFSFEKFLCVVNLVSPKNLNKLIYAIYMWRWRKIDFNKIKVNINYKKRKKVKYKLN